MTSGTVQKCMFGEVRLRLDFCGCDFKSLLFAEERAPRPALATPRWGAAARQLGSQATD